MAKAKEKNGKNEMVMSKSPFDITKPIVKDFFDKNAEINQFISLRMPYISGTTIKINRVFLSKDSLTSRYRVNYYKEMQNNAGELAIPVNSIVASKYVEVKTIDGQLQMTIS